MFSYDLGDGAELRLFEPRFAADFLALAEENRDFFGQWLTWAYRINTLDDARDFLQEDVDQFAEYGLSGIGIWQDKELVGGIFFFPIEKMIRATKIAYFLAKKANGRGLMTRAIRPVLGYVFEDLKLNRVGLEAEPANLKSKRMAERLGFTFEGIRRDGWQTKGEFVDIGVYSMLAADWRKMNG
jgi:ribosomal-protein-serine acetyltransferase